MAESYPCPKCGHPVEHTHGAIGRPPWCFCRACGTMFNPEHTNTQPLDLADPTPGPAPAEPVQEDTVTEPTETPAAEAKAPREVKHRPDPNTPFTDDDLAKLPNWAQGKVKALNAQLVHALEQLAEQRTGDAQTGEARPAEGDTPLGLTVSEDGDLLNWQGENYTRHSLLVDHRFAAGARLARIAELVNEGLEELLPELEDDNDE